MSDRQEQIREALAAREHEQWADYMRYFLDHLPDASQELFPGKWIGQDYVNNLRRLIDTPYAELSEKQKDNDRAEADRVLAILASFEQQP